MSENPYKPASLYGRERVYAGGRECESEWMWGGGHTCLGEKGGGRNTKTDNGFVHAGADACVCMSFAKGNASGKQREGRGTHAMSTVR